MKDDKAEFTLTNRMRHKQRKNKEIANRTRPVVRSDHPIMLNTASPIIKNELFTKSDDQLNY